MVSRIPLIPGGVERLVGQGSWTGDEGKICRGTDSPGHAAWSARQDRFNHNGGLRQSRNPKAWDHAQERAILLQCAVGQLPQTATESSVPPHAMGSLQP